MSALATKIRSTRDLLNEDENETLVRLVEKVKQAAPEGMVAVESFQSGRSAFMTATDPFDFVDMSKDTPESRAIRRSFENVKKFVHLETIEVDFDDGL